MSAPKYYACQERALAPGSGDGWPKIINSPHSKHARLVRVDGELPEVERLRAALRGMVEQFAYWSPRWRGPGYWHGGLSALEDAFAALGCPDDVIPAPHARCQQPWCRQQATCGTPTPKGYKRLCGEHYRFYNPRFISE